MHVTHVYIDVVIDFSLTSRELLRLRCTKALMGMQVVGWRWLAYYENHNNVLFFYRFV